MKCLFANILVTIGKVVRSVSSGFVRVRRANQTKTDFRKSSVYHTFGRKRRYLRSTVGSSGHFASKSSELSFISWWIQSGRSCSEGSYHMHGETNIIQYEFVGYWFVRSTRAFYTGTGVGFCSIRTGKCRQCRLTTVIRNSSYLLTLLT